jgi:hypothetical protein
MKLSRHFSEAVENLILDWTSQIDGTQEIVWSGVIDRLWAIADHPTAGRGSPDAVHLPSRSSIHREFIFVSHHRVVARLGLVRSPPRVDQRNKSVEQICLLRSVACRVGMLAIGSAFLDKGVL